LSSPRSLLPLRELVVTSKESHIMGFSCSPDLV
jgi:hypothetical protein